MNPSIESVLTSFRRGASYVTRHGLLRTLRRVLARFVYGSQDFIITRAALNGSPVPDRTGDVTLRLATDLDLQQLDQLNAFGRRASVLRGHVKDGDWLFIARQGDRVVGERIMMRTVPPESLTARVLKFMPAQLWDHDNFCVPDCRCKGIARHLSLFSDRYLAGLGYTETFAGIGTDNVPALKMQLHKGSEFAYHISYRRLLVYRRFCVSRDVPRARPGTDTIALLPVWRGSLPRR
jgi:hypothetical protein